MRDILFRGKCKATGDWYEGQYIHLTKTTYCNKDACDTDNDIHQIVFEQMTDFGQPNRHLRVDILPETVGQYTGLTDKNGKKIFEGDILLVKTEYESLDKEKRHKEYTAKGVVVFEGGTFVLHGEGLILPTYWGVKCLFSASKFQGYEIVGNVHDSPDAANPSE